MKRSVVVMLVAGCCAAAMVGAANADPARVATGASLVTTASPARQASGREGAVWPDVDRVFERFDRSNAPGCALGIVQDGELVYARGYGMANLEHGIAITPQTVFRTGSVGKQFTAAAVAIAAREGALSLDDPVRKWIPTLPAYPVGPTVRHLVHHTSGVRDYLVLMDLRGLRGDDFYTDAEVLDILSRQRELNFAPGAEHLYSNSGYFLLGKVILAATGKSLREYAQEKIFAPLGMRYTHFHDDHNHIVANRAMGYAPAQGGFRTSVTTLDMVGDGGVFTSIEDLVFWVNALQDDTLADGLTAMLETRGMLDNGETIAYAFGQTHGEYRGLSTVGHGGSFVGFRADITRFPEQRTAIMTLCNRSDAAPGRLARRVADAVLADQLGPAPAADGEAGRQESESTEPGPVANVDDYVGSYYSEELDVVYKLSRDGGALLLQVGQGIDGELRSADEDVLVLRWLTLRFERREGRVIGFEVDAGRVQHLGFVRRDGSP